jgi:tol-pal system protein YbgF
MKLKFLVRPTLVGVTCLFTTGVCLAQAPVVDANSTNTQQNAQTTTSGNASLPAIPDAFELQDRLAILERIVDSRTESQQRMQTQLDDLQYDIDQMKGSIELHNHQLEKLLERQRELYLELDRRFESMQQNTDSLASGITDMSGNGSTNAPAVANPAGEQDAYQAAVNLILKDKDYEKAVPAFQSFLSQYPNSELTDNAHYWLGQLLYNQQRYELAKEQFEQVVDKFESSPKRADSLLKLALIEKSIGNLNAANIRFQQTVDEYPDSTSAREAARQLAN